MALVVGGIAVRDVRLGNRELSEVRYGNTVVWQRNTVPYLILASERAELDSSGSATVGVEANVRWTVEAIYEVKFSADVVWLTEANGFRDDIEIVTTSYWETE